MGSPKTKFESTKGKETWLIELIYLDELKNEAFHDSKILKEMTYAFHDTCLFKVDFYN